MRGLIANGLEGTNTVGYMVTLEFLFATVNGEQEEPAAAGVADSFIFEGEVAIAVRDDID